MAGAAPEMREGLGSEEVKAGSGSADEFLAAGWLSSDGEQRDLKPDTPFPFEASFRGAPQSPVTAGFSPEEVSPVTVASLRSDGRGCPCLSLSTFLTRPLRALKVWVFQWITAPL